ncbi:hypothetical protein EDB80DRAFT_875189 [Ilyonectria destructans]|nr:hypothetical protein EDB80DRAFT_875189 [Ilyonectria destructans]
MQLSQILLFGLATIVHTALAAHCRIGGAYRTDCCWGGNDGYKSCQSQNHNSQFCKSDSANYCTNIIRDGEPVSKTCDADCCNTLNGWGTGCPK